MRNRIVPRQSILLLYRQQLHFYNTKGDIFMISLQDLLGQEQGDAAVDHISRNVGAEPSVVNSAIQAALPMLINGLANNASTPEGAQDLNDTLEQHHDGGILANLGGLAGM